MELNASDRTSLNQTHHHARVPLLWPRSGVGSCHRTSITHTHLSTRPGMGRVVRTCPCFFFTPHTQGGVISIQLADALVQGGGPHTASPREDWLTHTSGDRWPPLSTVPTQPTGTNYRVEVPPFRSNCKQARTACSSLIPIGQAATGLVAQIGSHRLVDSHWGHITPSHLRVAPRQCHQGVCSTPGHGFRLRCVQSVSITG